MKKFLPMFFLACFALSAVAQDRAVKGKVTSSDDGNPLPGVNVILKGTTSGTVTDVNGEFSLTLPPAGGSLVFSFIGLRQEEIEIGNQSSIDVRMVGDSKQLSEVIVTGSFGLQKQAKEVGYAASTITAREITQAKAVDIAQSLNGKISGVNITTNNSGVFQNSKINIRGIRSLTGNNQPMLVVDGAQVPLNMLATISPEDIADLTVLKSAASAALYGPDAVNGVFVVTTKRGKSNQNPTVNISSSYQVTKVAFFPKLQHEFGQGAGETTDQYGQFGQVPYENQLYGPRFDGTIKQIGPVLEDGTFQSGPYSNLHQKDKINFWNSGSTIQNSISLTGNDYFISMQDANVKGLMPDDQSRRTTVRLNGDKKHGKFSINYGVGYTLGKSDVVNENAIQNLYANGSYSGSIMFSVLQTADNIPLLSYKDLNSKYGQYSNFYNEFSPSPYWLIKNLRSKTSSGNFIGNTTLKYEITPWLSATGRFNISMNDTRTDNISQPLQVSDWALAHRNGTQYFNAKGSVLNDQFHSALFNIDYFLNGKTNAGHNLTVSYLVGGNFRETTEKDVAVGGNNLVVPNLYNVSVRSGDAYLPTYTNILGALLPINPNANYNYTLLAKRVSAYGTVGVGFKDWAFAEVTARNDWDSRLAPANRSVFYPSANVSAVLSDAIPQIKESPLSFLKLRAAISKSGNVNLNPYSLQATYGQPTGFPFGSVAGFSAGNTIPSNNLKPETVISKEIGLEFGFLDGKFDLEATYFNQACNNQILTATLPASTGYTGGLANAAAFTNRGFELDLGVAPYKIGRGGLSFKVNATYNTSIVTATPGGNPVVIGGAGTANAPQIATGSGSPTANNIAVVGGPAFQFQLSDYVRDPATGKVVVDALSGNPSQSTTLANRGRTLPKWILGFTPRYEIGGFSVSMTWDYKTGHQFYSGLGPDMDFSGISARSASYGRQRFVFPNSVYKGGDGQFHNNTNIQVQDGNYNFWTGSSTNTGIGTNYFGSATAFRLREVNITYTLPHQLIAGLKYVKKISFSLIGRNLLLLVPKSNQWGDPEFSFGSVGNAAGLGTSFQTPSSRLYGGSLNLTF